MRVLLLILGFLLSGFARGVFGLLLGPWMWIQKQLDNIELSTAERYQRIARISVFMGRILVYIVIIVAIVLMFG